MKDIALHSQPLFERGDLYACTFHGTGITYDVHEDVKQGGG
jgi:hypothetical protein